jgi:hypothetical protein
LRADRIGFAAVRVSATGSNMSAVAVSEVAVDWPPAIRTFPFRRRVAVRSARGDDISFQRSHDPWPGCTPGAGDDDADGLGLAADEDEAEADGDADFGLGELVLKDFGLGELVLTRGPFGLQAAATTIPMMTATALAGALPFISLPRA